MPIVPSIQIPDAAALPSRSTFSSPLTPKTPRSMLRNLFVWKKTWSAHDSNVAMSSDSDADNRPQTASSSSQQPVITRNPSLSTRSRSDTSVPQRSKSRSKSRRRSRSRCRAIWDPPPLFKAYREAFIHDILQIPSRGFLDWLPRNTPTRSNPKSPDSSEDDKVDINSPSSGHRRSMSDSSSSILSRKLFFLFENGHILQYKSEGSQDRLPERVLELSRESIAFASDAIVGQHWVLEIWPNGREENETKTAPSRLPWSRITLKAQDAKRLAEKLLLVFDSPDSLDNWLFAIRKHIEGLGGLEYQPDTPPLPQLEAKWPTLRHASSEYFKRKNGVLFSRSSSALTVKLDNPSIHEKELPQLPTDLSYQRSVSVRSAATSSVGTTTSLERFRESYSGSSTAGTALSSDVSATSLSPTKESFPPLLNHNLARTKSRTATDKAMPRTPTSPLYKSEERSPPFGTPPIVAHDDDAPPERKEESEEADSIPRAENDTISKSIPLVVVAHDTMVLPTQHPTPVLNTLPVLELRKRLRLAQRNLSANDVDVKARAALTTPLIERRIHSNKPSQSTSAKASYGLFPKKLALNVETEPLVISDQDHAPRLLQKQANNHLELSASSATSVASNFSADLSARSNTTYKRPTPLALTQLLAPVELEQPMRSPAVTDAMLDTNFGIMPNSASSQPATPIEIRVPSLSDIKVDKSLFESIQKIEAQNVSPSISPKCRSIATRRSLPNFHYGSASTVSAPVGPPPSGPLPAVPPVNEARSSRNLTPSKRVSRQSSGNRRASTKSASSYKKVRSPAQSFSFPPSQRRPSLSADVKLNPSHDVRKFSPILTSLPSNKTEEGAPTIGQVSIVSIPARTSSFAQHKKSLSTSSVKSHPSRLTHTRTPSSKSMHSSVASLPSISYLISPPCGFESDSDSFDKGCFGLSTSRSST